MARLGLGSRRQHGAHRVGKRRSLAPVAVRAARAPRAAAAAGTSTVTAAAASDSGVGFGYKLRRLLQPLLALHIDEGGGAPSSG